MPIRVVIIVFFYCYSEIESLKTWDSGGSERNQQSLVKIILTVVGGILILELVIATTSVIVWRRWNKTIIKPHLRSYNNSLINDVEIGRGAAATPRMFSYKELVVATNNFSMENKLGDRGFGAIYKGLIVDSDLEIPVKEISRSSRQGKKEYATEINILNQHRPRYILKLPGCCPTKREFRLVYEHKPNGKISNHLFGNNKNFSSNSQSLNERYKIALGLDHYCSIVMKNVKIVWCIVT